jgi:hypothetical protein
MGSFLSLLSPWIRTILVPKYLHYSIAHESPYAQEKQQEKQLQLHQSPATAFNFPDKFILRDLVAITAPVFELKTNPLQAKANESMRKWFLTSVFSILYASHSAHHPP